MNDTVRNDYKIEEIRPGVLNRKELASLSRRDIITNFQENDSDLSAFDLHLTAKCCHMKGSLKNLYNTSIPEIQIDDKYHKEDINLTTPFELKRKETYIIQIKEAIKFEETDSFHGRATGKSSIGRLDILTRLLVDRWPCYDEIPPTYKGSLYLEITPITFSIIVKEGISLSQLRIFSGDPKYSELTQDVLELYDNMLFEFDEKGTLLPISTNRIQDLRLDLKPVSINGQMASAFKAKELVKDPIDLTQDKHYNDPKKYWKTILCEDDVISIKPEKFYILRSKERFKLPDDIAVYAQAVTETLGEIRIHYAGFAHPGFGKLRRDDIGTPLTFEVRGHNVKTFLRDGEILARIKFYRMSDRHIFTAGEKEKAQADDFQNQELTLSSYFKKWDQ